MPNWINDPALSDDRQAFRILRTPADKPLVAIATCPDVIGCNTHYVGNRTVPCEKPNACKPHDEGFSFRWHGYVSAILTGTLEHILFEFTKTAGDTFKNYYLLNQTMRGCHFIAQRPSRRHNGRVVIACKTIDEQRTRLPDPPNIKAILCHIWNVQYQNIEDRGRVDFPFCEIGVLPSDGDGRNKLNPPQEPDKCQTPR